MGNDIVVTTFVVSRLSSFAEASAVVKRTMADKTAGKQAGAPMGKDYE